ncbi:MAG: P-II family nitrogen regulator [Pseudomonadota bacterium]
MKEVMAVIRANRVNQTKTALVDAGLPAFTGLAALGRGRKPVDFELLEAINQDPVRGAEVLPTLSQGGRLLPKRIVFLVVPDDRVPEVVQLLIKANQTGKPGDGKIFVLPVMEVYRVRTGEAGEQAIDEMKTS